MSFLFWSSVFLIVYTYVLYPLFIFLLARFFPKEILKNELVEGVTVIIVVYNESARIRKKIKNIFASDFPRELINVLVMSDGSNDDTQKIIDEMNDPNVRFVNNTERRGKAACLNDAFTLVDTQLVVLTDVRQEFEPAAIKNMLACLADPQVGAVSGELYFSSGDQNDFSQSVDAYWKYETFIRSNESRFSSTIGVTGAIYAIKKNCFQSIPSNTVLDDVLIPMNVVMQGKRVVFEPTAIAYDIPSADRVREEARKIRTLAGNYQLVALRSELINPLKNPAWIQYVSHKLLRLVMPIFLALLLLCSVLLFKNGWIYTLALLGQIVFYALPILSKIENPVLGKILNIRNAFVSMNIFAFKAMIEYVTNNNLHLWKK